MMPVLAPGSPVTVTQVDAFAERPFEGNPAAVCLLPDPRGERWMQQLAREMNLSETAFLRPRSDLVFDLRWFTPLVEVDLCGHATLASAHVLWESGIAPLGAAVNFETRSGRLTARRQAELIELDFPAVVAEATVPPPGLVEALGAEPRYVGRNEMDYLVELDSEDIVRGLSPDVRLLRQVKARGVIATARSSDSRFDFVSRFFAPAVGVDEDPVTGSAHCSLGPYWRQRLGRDTFTAYQASVRGGIVHVEVRDDRIRLGGRAVTVFTAELRC